MSKNEIKIVLLDADVISHFIACSELLFLAKILEPHPIVILETVYKEIARIKSRQIVLDCLISTNKNVSVLKFPISNIDIKKEYAFLKKINPLIGDGERACMAVAKYSKEIIASSNFRDIAAYCEANDILFLGTLDLLIIALSKEIFDENRCNDFISTAKSKNNARFPLYVTKISDYHPSDLSFI